MAILVDSNVILDVATNDPRWGHWSSQALAQAADESVLVINPIVFAEVSVGFDRVEDLEDALPPELYRRDPLPCEAAFLAGKCFLAYRRRGGRRAPPLPDFYIGAHAAIGGHRLLTRDARRYRTYFPRLLLIAPWGGASPSRRWRAPRGVKTLGSTRSADEPAVCVLPGHAWRSVRRPPFCGCREHLDTPLANKVDCGTGPARELGTSRYGR